MDISSCPQSRKDVLYTKAREAFGGARSTAAYYRLMRPYLGESLAWPSSCEGAVTPRASAPSESAVTLGAPQPRVRAL